MKRHKTAIRLALASLPVALVVGLALLGLLRTGARAGGEPDTVWRVRLPLIAGGSDAPPHGHVHCHTHAVRDGEPNPVNHAYEHGDSDEHGHGHADRNGHRDSHRYHDLNAHAQRDGQRDTDRHGLAHAHANQQVVRLLVAPYLGHTTSTSVIVSWATEDPGASEVRYSLDQAYDQVAAAASSLYDGKHWHEATIGGLAPGTTYHYRVYTAGQDLTPWFDITFTTAPAAGASSFTFAALGDGRPSSRSALPSQGAPVVAAALAGQSFDLAIHMGDIVNEGGVCTTSNSGWSQYIRAYFNLYAGSLGHTPLYPAIGNHELNGGACGYQSYTDVYALPGNAPSGAAEQYYSFDWANAHFIALDTSQGYAPGSAQYGWLAADLGATTQPWTFVFFHYPAYSSGLHGSEAAVQAYLAPLFEAHGVDLVFAGHDHHYERTCAIKSGACTTPGAGGVVHWVTGGAGAPLYPALGAWFTAHAASVYHFLLVTVDDCRLQVDALNVSGAVFDTYTLDACGSTP